MCSAGREKLIWIENNFSIIERVQDSTTSSSQWMQLIYVFRLGHPTMISVLFWDLSCSCSWNSQWKLPVNSFSGCYPLFPDSFSGFQMMLQFLGVAFSEDISGCLWYLAAFQRCWLCFSIMLLVPRLTAPRLTGNFSPRILADFSHWILFPFESGHLYGCSHHMFTVWFYFLPRCIYWKFIQLLRDQFE